MARVGDLWPRTKYEADEETITERAAVVKVAVLGSVVVACTTHTVTPSQTAADVASTASPLRGMDPLYEYRRGEVPFENSVLGQGATPAYSLRRLTIPSIGDNRQEGNAISGRYYRSNSEEPRPLVIVLPIFARFTYPSEKMSTYLQRHTNGAVHVLDVDGKNFLFDWSTLSQTPDEAVFMQEIRRGVETERTVVIDIRRLVDWAEQQPEIDGGRVALIGFSRSAIVAGLAATQEPRLGATVLIMGGAHPHQIVARCEGKRTSALQRNAKRRFGWDAHELERRIADDFSVVDAANYPGRVDPQSVLMFEAARDECITESPREALWEVMGRPQKFSLNYGHRIAFAAMTPLGGNWICDRTWEFLQQRLGVGE
jgi:dienelactone hydrolase